jgi:hypothetical protein
VIRPVRSFNPEIQQNKFDKDGVYRKWIKDLIWDGDPMVNMLWWETELLLLYKAGYWSSFFNCNNILMKEDHIKNCELRCDSSFKSEWQTAKFILINFSACH